MQAIKSQKRINAEKSRLDDDEIKWDDLSARVFEVILPPVKNEKKYTLTVVTPNKYPIVQPHIIVKPRPPVKGMTNPQGLLIFKSNSPMGIWSPVMTISSIVTTFLSMVDNKQALVA